MTDKKPEQPDPNERGKERINPLELPVPEVLGVLPLHNFVFFPGMGFPLQIANEPSKKLIDDALLHDRMIAAVSIKPESDVDNEEGFDTSKLYGVGVVCYIHKKIQAEEGFYQVLMSAVKKLRILEYTGREPFLTARVAVEEPQVPKDKEVDALILAIQTQFEKLVLQTPLPKELVMTLKGLSDPFHVAYLVVSQLNLPLDEEQQFLAINDVKELLRRCASDLNKRLETVEMSQAIQKSVKEDMDEKQREFFLRQQLKQIKKELGEDEDTNVELEELKKKLAATMMGEEPRKTAEKEIERLGKIPPSSPEYTVARNYLDWLLDLPWEKSTIDRLDIKEARAHLDEDHYGLEKIKKRILEFLAVRKLKQDMHGPILCFAGPPGVGKTSLGQSIARTMGRKFIRISLGGVRDEAEIRGHRRTYIGALPGRIIQSLRKAGSNNPLFMLDEIDKMGMDFRGDPSSALLEVLDPEQNFTFADHYLEIPFDLSKVMFITTANMLDSIPGPLRDRMEVVELPGYTQDEKLAIARRHLVAKQLEAHALSKDDIEFDDEALKRIIASYTREAGVRNLEREIAAVCRGVATEIVAGELVGVKKVTPDDLEKYLGPIRFFPETTTRTWGPGLVTGLAWTPVGGAILFIEAAKMPGKGGLLLTGKLGDVMKESAQAALSFLRANSERFKLNEKEFSGHDIHVHIPEGAIPKDGPSAGVGMVTALYSLLSGKEARKDIAMTGEITLRGDVLPVGGIKEKMLAAIRAGITELIVPYLNEKDVLEVPEKSRKDVVFHYVHTIDEVLDTAIRPTPVAPSAKKTRRRQP